MRLSWYLRIAACILADAALMPALAPAATLQMVVQSHPGAGGKCLDVADARFSPGMRLQTWDCNGTVAQTFSYDETNQQLTIGNLCVESWGRGDPQDTIGLGRCNGQPQQHWKMVASGDYYRILGAKDLCIDIKWADKANGTSLNLQTCQSRDNQLWALVEAPASPMQIAGKWCSKEGPNTPELQTSIEQETLELKLHNEHGQISRGHFIGASEIIADDWGHLHAQVSADGNQIKWTNGSVWERKPNCSGELVGTWKSNWGPVTIAVAGDGPITGAWAQKERMVGILQQGVLRPERRNARVFHVPTVEQRDRHS